MFSFKFEKTLPYLLGGVFVFFLLRKKNSLEVKNIEENSSSHKVKYLTMSDSEKDVYCKSVAQDLRSEMDFLFLPILSNPTLVALVKSNEFCILRVAEIYDKYWFFGSLSRELRIHLTRSDEAKISDIIYLLEANEL